MCMNCLKYRSHAHGAAHDNNHEAPPPPASSLWHNAISRGQLLRGVGGGLAASMLGGFLHWSMSQADADTLPYVVLIVLDGARPEYFTLPNTPNLKALMTGGTNYINAFSGILESETPSGHAAIATGWEPKRTGIPSFWWGHNGQRISLFSPAKIRAGDMERIIRNAKVPTIAGLVHANYPHAKVVALSGSKYYAADAIGGPDADVTMYFSGNAAGQWAPTFVPGHQPPNSVLNNPLLRHASTNLPRGVENHLAMQLAIDTFTTIKQRVTLINQPEFDWPLGHVKGGVLDQVTAQLLMTQFDRDLGQLKAAYERAGVLNQTIFVVMADHGMMPLTHRIPEADITNAVTRAGATLVAQTYTSAVYLWIKEADKVAQVGRNLAAQNNPYIKSVHVRTKTSKGMIYARATNKSRMRAAGTPAATQYLLNTFNGDTAPDVVLSLTEGVGVEPGGQSGWLADHGGTSWQAQHLPLIISGPGVRSNYVSNYPARLIDVSPTILALMGIGHKRMQGITLADAMRAPSSAAAKQQKALQPRLYQVVSALQKESKLDVAAHV
jgi:arylsulfatase A-like enzyme